MPEPKREQPLVERLARHFPENWTVTVEGDEIHISDGESPATWEAWISSEYQDEHEIVRLTFLVMHSDLKCIPNEGK